MKTIFFEWQEFEDLVKEKFDIKLPTDIQFTSEKFNVKEAVGAEIVSIFVDSRISNEDLEILKNGGLKKILLRCAGFNMLDTEYAKVIGIEVYRVASYSPESIAEFAVALMLSLARKLNFQRKLHEQLENSRTIKSMGFTLRGKKLGLHGYGKIGRELADIARDGFKMQILFFDPFVTESDKDTKVNTLEELYTQSDVVSIHMPLNDQTKSSVNKDLLSNVRPNFMLINTSRGPIVDNLDIKTLIASGKLSYFGTDVWGDTDKFDVDLLNDNTIQTDHVAFFTEEGVKSILEQTLESLLGISVREENII